VAATTGCREGFSGGAFSLNDAMSLSVTIEYTAQLGRDIHGACQNPMITEHID
jgi:hypothetical protein